MSEIHPINEHLRPLNGSSSGDLGLGAVSLIGSGIGEATGTRTFIRNFADQGLIVTNYFISLAELRKRARSISAQELGVVVAVNTLPDSIDPSLMLAPFILECVGKNPRSVFASVLHPIPQRQQEELVGRGFDRIAEHHPYPQRVMINAALLAAELSALRQSA